MQSEMTHLCALQRCNRTRWLKKKTVEISKHMLLQNGSIKWVSRLLVWFLHLLLLPEALYINKGRRTLPNFSWVNLSLTLASGVTKSLSTNLLFR